MGASRLSAPAFVERRPVLDALRIALDRARSGHGSLLLLVGDAGIGKSHTVDRLAALAVSEGIRVLWGSCLEEEGAPPFWPWIQALRALAEARVDPPAADQPDQHAIGELIERLAGRGRAPEPANEELPDAARFRLFEMVSALLRRAAQDHPILLVLDDLHTADRASVHLLAFVARGLARTRVLIVGTSRPKESTHHFSLFDTLGRTELQTLPLEGLAERDVRQLLAGIMGMDPPRALVRAVTDLTEGNPFFVAEIARWLVREQVVNEHQAARLAVPESVQAVIARRFTRLPESTLELLRIAAILGRNVDVGLVRAIRGASREVDLLDELDEAVQAHVLEERAGEAQFRFSHELIRQVLYEEVPPGVRIRLHAMAVSVLAARYGTDEDQHASELAYHAGKARALLGPETLARYSRLAGEHALATHAYDEAAFHLEQAIACREHLPLDAETAELFYGLGRAKAATSRRWNRQDAWECLRRACDYYVAVGDAERAVATVTHPAITPEAVTGVLEVIELVRALVPPGSRAAGWLEARSAAAHYFERGDDEAASHGFARALTIARSSNDPALELRTMALETAVDHFDLRWSGVLEKSRRVIRLARKIDDPHAATYARYRLAYALAYTGCAAEALPEAQQNLVDAEILADDGLLEDALYINAALAQLRGDWSGARRFSDRGLDLAPPHLALLHLRVLLEFEVGEPEVGRAYLGRLLQASVHAGPYSLREAYRAVVIPQLALLGGEQVGLEAKSSVLAANPNATALMKVGRALTAVHTGNVAEAEDALRALATKKGSIVAPVLVTERLLGLLSHTVGSLEAAIGYYEDALHFCRYAGYRPELAWSCLDYARVLLARDRKEDRAHAAALLAEAEAIAQELGMRPLLDRITDFRQRHRAKLDRHDAALSPREVKVARLIAMGKTNQEIADDLFISTHTVAAHVARILAKTGCKNRTEAAAFVERELRAMPTAEK